MTQPHNLQDEGDKTPSLANRIVQSVWLEAAYCLALAATCIAMLRVEPNRGIVGDILEGFFLMSTMWYVAGLNARVRHQFKAGD